MTKKSYCKKSIYQEEEKKQNKKHLDIIDILAEHTKKRNTAGGAHGYGFYIDFIIVF